MDKLLKSKRILRLTRRLGRTQPQQVRENYGLFELAPGTPGDGTYIDIVAVHGLGGDWEATWTDADDNCLWLRDFVPKQFQETNLRIWSFGYDSKTAFTNSKADIDDAATALVDALNGVRRGQNSRQNPIVFVAHSLGGIIVKRAINVAHERSDLWKDIVDSVFSIIFFAVPHRGADAAYWATVAANVYNCATLGFKGNKNFVDALKQNSQQFWQISNAFILPASKVKIIRSFYETKKIANIIIVDKPSAILGLRNETPAPIQGSNHRDICKFFSSESQKYRPVRNALEDIIERARHYENPIDSEEANFLDNLRFPHMLECLEWEHTSSYHQWLFLNKTFQLWMKSPAGPTRSRILWVIGPPRSGKTTAMSGAYHHLLKEQEVVEGRHQVVAFFFQITEEPLLRSPDGMYRALLCQVLGTESAIARKVLELASPRVNCRILLLNALKVSCKHFQRVTIFVDALDVCRDDGRVQFDMFLHTLTDSSSDEFQNLKICLSCRYHGACRWSWLDKLYVSRPDDGLSEKQIPIVEVQLENHDAIRTYINETLRLYSPDTDELVEIKEEIAEMSLGIFLWAESMVKRLIDSLLQNQAGQLGIWPQPVPDALKTVYSEVLCTAREPLKTWRLFQWIFLAPDLGLKGWRDLIPFLQDKTPSSLKKARGQRSKDWARGHKSKDWAMSSDTATGDDQWVAQLRRIICRLSLGLAQVAPLPKTSLEGPIGDYHSAAGEAGSWVTADGNKWVVRPVHHSVRQFLQDENGFVILNPKVKDHRGEGLMMAMMTCLDFINVREFSGLNAVSNARSIRNSEGGTDSIVSDGEASARTSITSRSISSARSIQRRHFLSGMPSHPLGSSGESTTMSSEESEFNEGDLHIAVLAHLRQQAVRYPVPSQDKQLQIKAWLQTLEGAFDDPSPESSPGLQASTRSTTLDVWSSELLAYVMTAFRDFAKEAEGAGVNPTAVVIKLREGRLWARLRCLCEDSGKSTTLKQWAESQGLQTWVSYLARTKANPYICPTSREAESSKSSILKGFDMNLSYCFDGGTRSLLRLEGRASHNSTNWRPLQPELIDSSMEDQLGDQLRDAMSQCNKPWTGSFIPYRTLRRILTEEVLADLLRRHTGLDPDMVPEIRKSCIRVLGILLLMGQVSHIERLFDQMNDAWLPIKLKPRDPKPSKNVSLKSQVPGKGLFVTDCLDTRQWIQFEEYQWTFLSPFLAKRAGQVQHYNLVSEKQPFPIVEVEPQKSKRTGFEHELQQTIRFHPESFHFGKGKMRYKSKRSCRHELLLLRRVTWKRFLSIVYPWKLIGEQKHTKFGVIPLLCTLERPDRAAPSESEFALVFPSPRGDMNDLMRHRHWRTAWRGQLTERWLATQFCQMAASLAEIHRIAAIAMPHLPRLRFFRSGRLANDVVKWLSSSRTDLGSLVFTNLSTEVPTPAEAAPEYFINLERPRNQREAIARSESMFSKSRKSDCESGSNESLEEAEPKTRRSGALTLVLPSSSNHLEKAQQTGSQQATPGNSRHKSSFRASKFQVWCLGTIWLQLITWFLLGRRGMPDYAHIFYPKTNESGFLEVIRGTEDRKDDCSSYRLKDDVIGLFERLEAHKGGTVFIVQVLKLIRDEMLVVDADDRASSRVVALRINRISEWAGRFPRVGRK